MEPKLIETKEQLIENLNTVESYLCTDIDGDVFKEMAGYISRGRSFVAYKVNNSWHFAPSRFIGYISNSLVSHDTSKVDGTETNMALQAIFESRYFPDEKLEEAYFDYCNWLEVIPYNWPTRNFWVLDDFLSEAIELNCEEKVVSSSANI